MIYKKNKGKIGIIDYQAGNIQSIVNILKYYNQKVEIITIPQKIKKMINFLENMLINYKIF